MADDEKPRATLPSEAVRSPPQQNSTTDPPTAEAVKRVVEEIHAAEGYRFPQPPLSNTDADNPEWVGTVRIPSDFHPAPQTGSVEFKAGGGTPNATGDDTDEGLRALQKIARDRADLDRQLTEAAKPLADAAARLRENAAGQWEDYARRQTDRNLRYRAAVEREDKQDRQEAIADAIEQSGQSREKAPVAATEPISKPEKVNERGFNVALTTYGAMFGTGLLQLAARDWYFGPIFTIWWRTGPNVHPSSHATQASGHAFASGALGNDNGDMALFSGEYWLHNLRPLCGAAPGPYRPNMGNSNQRSKDTVGFGT